MAGGGETLREGIVGADRLLIAASRWARSKGAATAVSAPDGIFSFAEMVDHTRSLATLLQAEGVGVGTRVGLFLGRSRWSVSSLLAIWCLGATAVPMDDRHPVDRINFELRDADVRILLADQLPPGVAPQRARRVHPGDARPVPDSSAVFSRSTRLKTAECAYIIYTSGTTGWPKGVEVTYGNLGIFVDALADLDLAPSGMGINAVSPAFDGWLWCALLYLLHGQGMVIIDLSAGDDLDDLLAFHKPRTVCLTPTLLSAMRQLPAVDVLVVAGEPCSLALAQRLAGHRRVLNVYGPTETTIAATWSDTIRGDDPATIGRALPGYATYVLDEQLNPVPPGTAGQLHIGGPAVARGYCNRPELTADRFVPDPFRGAGSRMYRTGDLVIARPDGQLDFLGRKDNQVKVRGFRVELGELERVVAGSTDVQAAAAFVTSAGDALGLAVVITADADDGEWPVRIRRSCAQRLPDALVPAVVEVVPALPTMLTGKVDRSALARTITSPAVVARRAPSTECERQICQTWSELLSRTVADVDANFFDLGGHSLLAARAVAALRRSTGLRLTVRHLLAHPTAAALAAELDRLARQNAGDQ